MTQLVPSSDWRGVLERFGREHRARLATINAVDAHGATTGSTQVRLKSATGLVDAVQVEFLDGDHSLCVHRPSAVRIQQTDTGAAQALEIDTLHGDLIRLALRATARPDQLDGLAPGELIGEGRPH